MNLENQLAHSRNLTNNSKNQVARLFILIYITMILTGLTETVKAITLPAIKANFGISYQETGNLVSITTFAYVAVCFFATYYMKKIGIKYALFTGYLILITGFLLNLISFNYGMVTVAIVILTSSFGMFEVGNNALAMKLFVKRTALLFSFMHFFYGFGAIIGPYFAVWVLSIPFVAANGISAWRYIYVFLSVLPVILIGILLSAQFNGESNKDKEDKENKKDEIYSTQIYKENNKSAADNNRQNQTERDSTDIIAKNEIIICEKINQDIKDGEHRNSDLNHPTESDECTDYNSLSKTLTISQIFKMPEMWFFSLVLGLLVSVELSPVNWGPLYFQDIYGLSPETDGARFVSLFYLFFTGSRLFSGFITEKIGYYRSLVYCIIISILILIAGFNLGRNGIIIIPISGLFISQFWILVVSIINRRFKEEAGMISAIIITLVGIIVGISQILVGYTNEISNGYWGFRLSIIFSIVALALVTIGKKIIMGSAKEFKN